MFVRHLLSIALLPFMVVIAVPSWLLTAFAASDHRWNNASLPAWLPRSTGLVVFLIGLVLFVWCVSLFARVGKGTLAPWDPTRELVAVGPYRFVRNPMISGVVSMLFGEAIFFGSGFVALWACLFLSVNHLYFVLSEEPGLERRFGEAYRVYKANVPRWVPRLRSWQGR